MHLLRQKGHEHHAHYPQSHGGYGVRMADKAATPKVTVVPANEASWADLQAVFGTRGDPSRCHCQRYKMQPGESWASVGAEELALRLRRQTDCGHPESRTTSGLVAHLHGEPVGWCAVEPRTAYPRLLLKTRVPWEGRAEDKTDDSVWAVTCFVTRAGFRRRGISRALAGAAVDFARERGARALEGYPMITEPGKEITWGELHVGSRSIFADAGFTEVSRPTPRRVVMRIDFQLDVASLPVHRLTKAQARRIAVRAQLLDAARPTDLLTVVQQLTLLQIDPTAAIAPSADLVAWSRLGSAYQPAHLQHALEQDRTLFEHNALIRPMSDLGLYLAGAADWPSYAEHAHLDARQRLVSGATS